MMPVTKVPTPRNVLTDVVTVATGSEHACALLGDGKVKCWGNNGWGEVGVPPKGTAQDSIEYLPVQVTAIKDADRVLELAAGGMGAAPMMRDENNNGHSCARLDSGAVRCWGSDNFGQLGDNNHDDLAHPQPAADAWKEGGAAQIAAGAWHTCMVLGNGSAKCWGLDSEGELGNGKSDDSATPVDVLFP